MATKTKTKGGQTARGEVAGAAGELQNTFTTGAAARYLGVSAATLRLWRANNEGPKYFRAGDRLVRYRKVDLDRWIESRLSE
jgi:excisionase family DNA binding protein